MKIEIPASNEVGILCSVELLLLLVVDYRLNAFASRTTQSSGQLIISFTAGKAKSMTKILHNAKNSILITCLSQREGGKRPCATEHYNYGR